MPWSERAPGVADARGGCATRQRAVGEMSDSPGRQRRRSVEEEGNRCGRRGDGEGGGRTVPESQTDRSQAGGSLLLPIWQLLAINYFEINTPTGGSLPLPAALPLPSHELPPAPDAADIPAPEAEVYTLRLRAITT